MTNKSQTKTTETANAPAKTNQEQQKARSLLFCLGVLPAASLTREEILSLDLAVLSSLPQRKITSLWEALKKKKCSFKDQIKFLSRVEIYWKEIDAYWKEIYTHPRCTFSSLCGLVTLRRFNDYDLKMALEKIIFRRTDWKTEDLCKSLKKLKQEYASPALVALIAEVIVDRDDCSSEMLCEIAQGEYSHLHRQAPRIAAEKLLERNDCPLDFLLTCFFQGLADKREQTLSAIKKRIPELRQRAKGKTPKPA